MKIKHIRFKITWKEFKALLGLSILCNTCSLFFFLSYTYLGGGIATVVHFLYPVFVTLIMALFFKEKITIKNILSILVVILGVSLLSLSSGLGQINFKGISFALLAAMFYAFFLVFSGKSVAKDMPVLKFTFYIQIMGVIYLFLFCIITGTFQWFPLHDTSSLTNILLLALVPTILSVVTLIDAIRKIGSVFTSVLGAFEPITAVLVGIFMFSETFTLKMLAGILLIIAGVFGVISSQKK